MTRLQETYLEKMREAIENSAGDEEIDYILSSMKEDLTDAEYQNVIATLKNSTY